MSGTLRAKFAVKLDAVDTMDVLAPIDWNKVNARREELKGISLDYIKRALN